MTAALASALAGSLFAGASYADHWSTQVALARGGLERGQGSTAIRVVVPAAQTALFHEIHKKHKKTAWALVGVTLVVNGLIVQNNLKVAKELKK